MSRQSNLSKSAAVTGPPVEQDMPLDIPKKSKLCVEQVRHASPRSTAIRFKYDSGAPQSEREKMHAKAMHQTFQQALSRLRLATSRAFLKTMSNGFGAGDG